MNQAAVVKQTLMDIADKDENAYFVVMDGFETVFLNEISKKYPSRTVKCGISEQNAVSFSSGLALSGKTVFLLAPAAFISTRALEQLKVDLAYNNANVKILALMSGIVYNGNGGYSHWAVEDIANIRTFPNIKILSSATLKDAGFVINESYKNYGAYYIRMENIFSTFNLDNKIESNKLNCLLKGRKLALIATGNMVEYSYNIAQIYNEAGISTALYNCNTIKPFDCNTMNKIIKQFTHIVTLEEHTVGGLASIVSECIAKNSKKVNFLSVKIENENYQCTGSSQFIINNLINIDKCFNRIYKFATLNLFNFLNPIKVKFLKCNPLPLQIKFMLFGFIPLLKKVKREKRNPRKPDFKYYLFNFIRIV